MKSYDEACRWSQSSRQSPLTYKDRCRMFWADNRATEEEADESNATNWILWAAWRFIFPSRLHLGRVAGHSLLFARGLASK